MIFQQIPSGGDRNYGYVVGCEETGKAAVVDPSPDPHPCYDKIKELGLEAVYVINTHSHYDHAGGNAFFKKKSKARVVGCGSGSDLTVADGDSLELGQLTLKFIHTPGHTMDSMCVLVDKELVSGDTLFVGKVGGTYSRRDAEVEFESLKKLLDLADDIRVWPGHNYGVKPTSTIGEERQTNPFLLRIGDFEEFFWLKENWAAYKLEHGIK